MLSLQLNKGEYITVNGNIVIQAYPYGNRVALRVDAPREYPILRGAVAEKAGMARPDSVAKNEALSYKPKAKVRSQEHSERAAVYAERRERRRAEAEDALDTLRRMISEIDSEDIRSGLERQLELLHPAAQ